jgi:hypothetical protein
MRRNRISKDAFSQVVTMSLLARPAAAYLTSWQLQGCGRVPQVTSRTPSG